jgi:hypothetical protein
VQVPVTRLFGSLGADEVSSSSPSSSSAMSMQQHLFMLDDQREAMHNSGVVAFLRDQISLCVARRGTVKAHLEEALTNVQRRFVDSAETFELRLVKKQMDTAAANAEKKAVWRIVSACGDKPKPVAASAHEVHLPTYVALGSGDLRYNVMRIVGSTSTGGGTNVSATQQKKVIYLVQMVLPGMSKAAVEEVRATMKWNAAESALRMDVSDGSRALVLDFGATLDIAQRHVQDKLQLLMQEESEAAFVWESTEAVVDPGTRPTFTTLTDPLQHRAAVLLRVVIEKLSTVMRPTTVYSDGVLTVALVGPPVRAA